MSVDTLLLDEARHILYTHGPKLSLDEILDQSDHAIDAEEMHTTIKELHSRGEILVTLEDKGRPRYSLIESEGEPAGDWVAIPEPQPPLSEEELQVGAQLAQQQLRLALFSDGCLMIQRNGQLQEFDRAETDRLFEFLATWHTGIQHRLEVSHG